MTKLNFTWNNTDWSVPNITVSDLPTITPWKKMTSHSTPRARQPGKIVTLPSAPAPMNSLAVALANARREAEALAWSTGFPGLLLPCLREELEHRARDYWHHQREVRAQSERLLAESFDLRLRREAA